MNSISKKFVVSSILVAVLAVAAVAAPAKAATIEELQAQIASLTALIAQLQGSAPAASASYTRDLTIGSTGADVSSLQSMLVSKGMLVMPAGVSMGYFGNLTKNAVSAWQAANGITPAVGYFGPKSRAVANSMTVAPAPTPVPVGTPGPTPVVVADGTDGSLTVSYSPFAPSSQTLKKGDSGKSVIAVKLQATSGTVSVNRFDVQFSDRPWLYFAKLTLKDSSGNTIATKSLSSASDATEITVGSNYLVRFDNINYQVVPGTDATLVVYLDVLAASDKINNNVVYVGIPTGNIRSVNGKGYTDSLGISSGTGSGVTSSTGVAITLSSTGSTGSITTRVSPSSPLKRTVAVSPTASTPDVTLGIFGLKSQNQSASISSLTFTVQSTSSVATTTLYSNARLYNNSTGALISGANSLNGAATFTNLNLALPVDQWVDVKLVADVPSANGGQAASTTLAGGALIVGTDSNFNSLTVSAASNQTSSDNVYSYSGLNVVASAPTITNCANTMGGTATNPTTCSMTFNLTLTAAANNAGDIFISKTPGIVLATTTYINGAASAVSSTTLNTIGIAAIAGDTSVSYRVPTEGRTFTFLGTFSKAGGAASLEKFQINKIWFGTVGTTNGPTSTASSNASDSIDYGLESAFASMNL